MFAGCAELCAETGDGVCAKKIAAPSRVKAPVKTTSVLRVAIAIPSLGHRTLGHLAIASRAQLAQALRLSPVTRMKLPMIALKRQSQL